MKYAFLFQTFEIIQKGTAVAFTRREGHKRGYSTSSGSGCGCSCGCSLPVDGGLGKRGRGASGVCWAYGRVVDRPTKAYKGGDQTIYYPNSAYGVQKNIHLKPTSRSNKALT